MSAWSLSPGPGREEGNVLFRLAPAPREGAFGRSGVAPPRALPRLLPPPRALGPRAAVPALRRRTPAIAAGSSGGPCLRSRLTLTCSPGLRGTTTTRRPSTTHASHQPRARVTGPLETRDAAVLGDHRVPSRQVAATVKCARRGKGESDASRDRFTDQGSGAIPLRPPTGGV